MSHAVHQPEASQREPTAVDRSAGEASRKYVVEAIGTFFLCFTVVTGALSNVVFTPLAAGAMLMVMAYAGAHISGGHYNPAVTAAVLWRRRIGVRDAIGYWLAQLAAGVVAAFVADAVVVHQKAVTLSPTGRLLTAAAVVELVYTFALCFVVLNVATSRDQRGNGFYGIAIGFTVAAGAFVTGGISGGSFNPAVTLGGAVGGLYAWNTLWVYFVVELAAGGLAGLAFLQLNPADT
jgi:aquaporin Z